MRVTCACKQRSLLFPSKSLQVLVSPLGSHPQNHREVVGDFVCCWIYSGLCALLDLQDDFEISFVEVRGSTSSSWSVADPALMVLKTYFLLRISRWREGAGPSDVSDESHSRLYGDASLDILIRSTAVTERDQEYLTEMRTVHQQLHAYLAGSKRPGTSSKLALV